VRERRVNKNEFYASCDIKRNVYFFNLIQVNAKKKKRFEWFNENQCINETKAIVEDSRNLKEIPKKRALH
jgi:hypothetical protein